MYRNVIFQSISPTDVLHALYVHALYDASIGNEHSLLKLAKFVSSACFQSGCNDFPFQINFNSPAGKEMNIYTHIFLLTSTTYVCLNVICHTFDSHILTL